MPMRGWTITRKQKLEPDWSALLHSIYSKYGDVALSHWRVEIPQRRLEDSAQVHQTLFLLGAGGGVWVRDCTSGAIAEL
jgi:hypothetical protein